MMGFLVLFLHDERGYSDGAAAAVFAIGQALAAVLRIGIGRWSDVMRARIRPFRLVGVGVTIVVASRRPAAASGGDWILVPVLVLATGLSMGWNGLAFTIAAEIGGRRSGAAIGFQQTALSAVGVIAPIRLRGNGVVVVLADGVRARRRLPARGRLAAAAARRAVANAAARVGGAHAALPRPALRAARPDRPRRRRADRARSSSPRSGSRCTTPSTTSPCSGKASRRPATRCPAASTRPPTRWTGRRSSGDRLGDALRAAGGGTGGEVADLGHGGEDAAHRLANLLGAADVRAARLAAPALGRPAACRADPTPERTRRERSRS